MVGLIDNPMFSPYLCHIASWGLSADAPGRSIARDDAAEIVEPDTRFRYGGGQWQLAGGIAEAASGKSWDELVRETYVDTCGLGVVGYSNHFQQAFLESGELADALSYPNFFDGDVADLPRTRNINVEGGAYTTVEDYAEVLLVHLRGGRCTNGERRTEPSVRGADARGSHRRGL